MQLDLHADYNVPLGSRFEKYRLKLAMDMFNVTNSQFQTGTYPVHADDSVGCWGAAAAQPGLQPSDRIPDAVLCARFCAV